MPDWSHNKQQRVDKLINRIHAGLLGAGILAGLGAWFLHVRPEVFPGGVKGIMAVLFPLGAGLAGMMAGSLLSLICVQPWKSYVRRRSGDGS